MTTTTQTTPPLPIIIKILVTAIKNLGHGTNVDSIIKEFKWHQKANPDSRETVLNQTPHIVFALMKEGSPFIQVVPSVAEFGGDSFNPVEYHGHTIGFAGDCVQGMEPILILIRDDACKWTEYKVVTDPVPKVIF